MLGIVGMVTVVVARVLLELPPFGPYFPIVSAGFLVWGFNLGALLRGR